MNILQDITTLVEEAAPGLEQAVVNDAKDALIKAEAALVPIAEAIAAKLVNTLLSGIPGGGLGGGFTLMIVNKAIECLNAKIPHLQS